MHRIALSRRGPSAVTRVHGSVQGWSVLARPKRNFSDGPEDQATPREDEPLPTAGTRVVGSETPSNVPPAGRGRGAFSQYLRLNERKIDAHIQSIERRTSEEGVLEGGESGQFDDPEDVAGEKRESENWQEKWFAHEDRRLDELEDEDEVEDMQGDMQELDDDEEDDHFDFTDEYMEELGQEYSAEEIKKLKDLAQRLEREEREQMQALWSNWEETKRAAEEEHGTSSHLELPDIIITHELSCEAPPGEAVSDRALPLPRPAEAIIGSMELPAGLDVRPDDPEYEEVMKMWTTIDRNNTMDEKMKKNMIQQISTFIAKHRNSTAFDEALSTQDIPEVQEKRRS